MASYLIAYGTGEGQTGKVAQRIGAVLRTAGHRTEVVDLAQPPTPPPTDFDAVLVGASVHDGKLQPSVTSFVRQHQAVLQAYPSAYFQCSITSAMRYGWMRGFAAEFARPLFDLVDWQPRHQGYFAGALPYSRLSLKERWLLRVMMLGFGQLAGVNTARDHEFTDWDAVDAFARDCAAFVGPD